MTTTTLLLSTPPQAQFAAGVLRTLAYWRTELAAYASDPAALDAEHANLARAVGWGLAFPATREAAFDLLAEMHEVVLGRGALALWQDLLQGAAEYAPRTPAGVAVLRLTAEVLENRGHVEAAVRLFRRAAALARWLGDEALMLMVQAEWGRCWCDYHHEQRGTRWLENVLARARRREIKPVQVSVGLKLAVHYDLTGQLPRALACLTEALVLAHALGDSEHLARLWTRHGNCLWQLERLEEAEDSLARGWIYALQIGHRRVQGTIILTRGIIHHARADYVGALTLFQSARQIYVEAGDLIQMAWIDQNLAATYWGLQDWVHMYYHFQAAITFWRSIRAWRHVTRVLLEMASGCGAGLDPLYLPAAREALREAQGLLAAYGQGDEWQALWQRQREVAEEIGAAVPAGIAESGNWLEQ